MNGVEPSTAQSSCVVWTKNFLDKHNYLVHLIVIVINDILKFAFAKPHTDFQCPDLTCIRVTDPSKTHCKKLGSVRMLGDPDPRYPQWLRPCCSLLLNRALCALVAVIDRYDERDATIHRV